MKRTMMAAVAAVMAACAGVAQTYVEISAEIELVSYSSRGTNGAANAKPKTISLTCVAGTNDWWMENDFVQGGDPRQWYFDGTNVCSTLRAVGNPQVTIDVWSSQDGHPMGFVSENIPWLAFCSGPYLKRAGRIIPLPADTLRHTPDRYAYTDKTTVFADDLGLPQTVDLLTSKSLLEASENDFHKEGFMGDRYAAWTKKNAAELQEGILMFHYAVIESTNFLGRNYPTKFEFFQNPRKYVQNGEWFCRGVGRVKSLRSATRPTGLFASGQSYSIVDWRFRDETSHVNGIIYQTTNAWLSPMDEPELQKKFEARKQESRARLSKRQTEK